MLCLSILLLNLLIFAAGSCPNGQIASVSDPTICYSFEKTKMNWIGAMEACKEKGGNLVSIHDQFSNMFISGEANSFFTDSTTTDFWIGAIFNSISPGKWSWIDNSPFDFTDWDKGQPQNVTDSTCATAIMNGAKWQASDCFIEKPFVCEINQMPITTTQEPRICPETWEYLNSTNFCYKAFQIKTTWYNAEMACVNQGAHLASIHSYEENLFIAYITNKEGNNCDWYTQTWIGLSNNDGSNFKWTDGTPFDYKSWAQGAPNGNNHHCVITWIGQTCYGDGWVCAATQWNNVLCENVALNSVCKKARL